eukprot:11707142-Alexandrium_andersonii.AAC.1
MGRGKACADTTGWRPRSALSGCRYSTGHRQPAKRLLFRSSIGVCKPRSLTGSGCTASGGQESIQRQHQRG